MYTSIRDPSAWARVRAVVPPTVFNVVAGFSFPVQCPGAERRSYSLRCSTTQGRYRQKADRNSRFNSTTTCRRAAFSTRTIACYIRGERAKKKNRFPWRRRFPDDSSEKSIIFPSRYCPRRARTDRTAEFRPGRPSPNVSVHSSSNVVKNRSFYGFTIRRTVRTCKRIALTSIINNRVTERTLRGRNVCAGACSSNARPSTTIQCAPRTCCSYV